jgi:hypothetical protein
MPVNVVVQITFRGRFPLVWSSAKAKENHLEAALSPANFTNSDRSE